MKMIHYIPSIDRTAGGTSTLYAGACQGIGQAGRGAYPYTCIGESVANGELYNTLYSAI